jgi:hypothetical protein
MTITLTLGEALERGIWEELCTLKGLNPWCLKEGLADRSDTVSLTAEEASSLRLLPSR